MNKVKTIEELVEIRNGFKQKDKKVVFTNGCFDLIHTGHTRYLNEARELGDCLVVAVNSDASVRQIKGEKRPVIPQNERAEIIAALESVDYVIIFTDPDPFNIIKLLKPDFLVKGGDWGSGTIIGSDIVEAAGGKVLRITYNKGSSTTNIIERIQNRYCRG